MIKYEFRKLSQQKIGLLLIMSGIIIASLLFLESDNFKTTIYQLDDVEIIKEYDAEISDMSYSEALKWLKKEYEFQNELFLIERKENDDKSRMLRTSVLWNMINKYKYLDNYNNYIQSVLNQAEKMQKVALFRDSRYADENIIQTKKDYTSLIELKLSKDAPQFVADTTSFKTGDYILFILILILVVLIYGYEEGSDGKNLLWVQYNGRLHIFFAKLVTVLISGTVLITLYYGIILFIGCYFNKDLNGVANFGAMIQSLPEFQSCTYLITVAEYLLIFIIFKIISGWLLMIITVATVSFAGNNGGMLLSVGLLGLWYSAYRWIGPESIWSPLKYLNPIAWFDVHQWISTYRNINFFSNAIPFSYGFFIGITVGIILSLAISLKMYFLSNVWRTPKLLLKIMKELRRLSEKTAENTSLTYQEGYRLLVANKQWILIILIPMAFNVCYRNLNTENLQSFKFVSYGYYINNIDKEYSHSTEEYINTRRSYLIEADGYRDSLNRKLQKGELTEEEYRMRIQEFEDDKMTSGGFSELVKQADYLKSVYESGREGVGFFHFNFGGQLFSRKLNNIDLGFAIVAILMILYTRFLQSDYDISKLIKSLTLGRKETLRIRATYLIVFSIIIGCIFYIPYYIKIWDNYDKQDFGLLIQSIEKFERFPLDLTIGQAFAISLVLKALGILGITLFMYFLSMWHLKKSAYQVSVMAFIFTPLIMGFVDAPFDYLLFGGMFYGEELLRNNFYMTCTYVGIMLVGMIAFGIISVRKYMGNWENGVNLWKKVQ